MNRAELEDLITLHNQQVDDDYNMLYAEWESLRRQAFNTLVPEVLRNLKWKCDALRTAMDKLKSERIELKESA